MIICENCGELLKGDGDITCKCGAKYVIKSKMPKRDNASLTVMWWNLRILIVVLVLIAILSTLCSRFGA